MSMSYQEENNDQFQIAKEVYQSLSLDNQKRYEDILIEEVCGFEFLDEFSEGLLNQIISTCDEEINWYSKAGYKLEDNEDKQELFLQAIKLKRYTMHYLNTKFKSNIKR